MDSDILGLLAEATEDGAYAVDMDQRIVFWNAAAERILGYKAEAVLGKQCYELLGGRAEEAEQEGCSRNCGAILWAQRGQIAPSHTIRTLTGDGRPRWITVTHVLLPAARPELGTLLHLFRDATEEVEAKQCVRRLRQILSEAPTASTPHTAPVSVGPRDSVDALSPRERDVLRLLAYGFGTDAIAQELVLSPVTVRNHIQRILAKLGVHTRLEAVVAALRYSLL